MNYSKLEIRLKKDISNNGGEVIRKGEIVTIKSIWSNDSKTILSCEIEKDNIVVITKLKNII